MDEHPYPTCSQQGCNAPAAFEYVWDKPMRACAEHMPRILAIAAAMGFPTPMNTMKFFDWDRWVKQLTVSDSDTD